MTPPPSADSTRPDHVALGRRFRELHESGTFVMANVADAGTAEAVAGVGIEAIATTSSGHAAMIGRADAAGEVSMDEHAEHTEILVNAVSVPCNVDAENGYGCLLYTSPSPRDTDKSRMPSSA